MKADDFGCTSSGIFSPVTGRGFSEKKQKLTRRNNTDKVIAEKLQAIDKVTASIELRDGFCLDMRAAELEMQIDESICKDVKYERVCVDQWLGRKPRLLGIAWGLGAYIREGFRHHDDNDFLAPTMLNAERGRPQYWEHVGDW